MDNVDLLHPLPQMRREITLIILLEASLKLAPPCPTQLPFNSSAQVPLLQLWVVTTSNMIFFLYIQRFFNWFHVMKIH